MHKVSFSLSVTLSLCDLLGRVEHKDGRRRNLEWVGGDTGADSLMVSVEATRGLSAIGYNKERGRKRRNLVLISSLPKSMYEKVFGCYFFLFAHSREVNCCGVGSLSPYSMA